jgi:Protein of unknown function (DUF3142)
MVLFCMFKSLSRPALVFFCALLFLPNLSCRSASSNTPAESKLDRIAPHKILWAWEREEDLRFIDSKEFGVAFLAQTVTLSGSSLRLEKRRQPLEVNPDTFLVAVTRIETDKPSKPKLTDEQKENAISAVLQTLELKNVAAVQIDFDAAVSEREFYRALLNDLRNKLPAEIPLSMTALASWCTAKSWLEGLPVDEAVPMAFRMGADDASIRAFLAHGKDWQEPLCKRSYGFSIDEPFEKKLVAGRRIYFFTDHAWQKNDLDIIGSESVPGTK